MQQLTAFTLGLTRISQADTESVHRTLQVNNTDSDSSQQSFYPTVVSEKKSQQCEPGFIAVVLFGNQKKNPLMTGNSSQTFYDFITLSKHAPENINTNNKQTKEKGEKLIRRCFARRYS